MPDSAGLVWGDVDLMMTGFNEAGYWIEASADGTTWGNPEAVVTAVRSRLQDGSLAQVTSYNEREATISIRVRGVDYDGLEAGAEALIAQTQREDYGTFTYTPSVSDGVASVFDVVYSTLDYSLVDLNEARLERHYTAKLMCLPFPRAAEETVALAVGPAPATETKVNIDDGSATTGWTVRTVGTSGTLTPAASSAGGAVSGIRSGDTGLVAVTLTKTTAIGSLNVTPYISVDWKQGGGTPFGEFSALGKNGATLVILTKVQEAPSPTLGYTRTLFKVEAGTVNMTEVSFSAASNSASSPIRSLTIDTVDRTDTIPAIGTRRQLARSIDVAGSVRTQGRLALEHETTALGEALIYVYKDDGTGFGPSGRPLRAGGGTVTSDSALYSGAYDNLNTATYFDYPLTALPSGNYEVLARLQRPTAATVTLSLTASTRVNSTDLSTVSRAPNVAIPASYAFCHVDYLDLSTTKLASPAAGTLRLTIEDPTDSNVRLDDIYLLNLDIGTVTIVSCGTGTPASGGPAKRLWLDPAMLTNDGESAIFIGHAADRSDAFDPGIAIKAWTPPLFVPSSMKVFTACNALDAAVTLSHFRRGLHHIRALAA